MSRAPLATFLLLLAACQSSPSQQAQELDQTRRSWEATARLTTMLRQRGAVPAEYARQTLDAAQEGLEKARRKAQEVTQ